MDSIMRSGIVIQARMASTRLPGKAMRTLCGVAVIEHMVRRLARVPVTEGVIVATTDRPEDDVLAELCPRLGAGVFRGHEHNVLRRVIDTARRFGLEAVVRLGGDSPLCDPGVVSRVLEAFLSETSRGRRLDYASNTLDRHYPVGLDVEVFHTDALRRIEAVVMGMGAEERRLNQENVVPYMHAHPDEFAMLNVGDGPDLSALRWTLDTPEDLELVKRIYEALYPVKPEFTMLDVLDVLELHPDWSAINAAVVPASGYWTPSEREKFADRFGAAARREGSRA